MLIVDDVVYEIQVAELDFERLDFLTFLNPEFHFVLLFLAALLVTESDELLGTLRRRLDVH